MAWTTKSPIRGNHWVPLGCRALLGSVKIIFQLLFQGKPVSLAKRMDIPRAVLNLRAFASGQCHLLETSNQLSDAGVINYTSRSPVGVAGLIAPWNLPLYLLTFKVVIFE